MSLTFETRLAQPADAAGIASAHLDSIRSIGSGYYPAGVVDDWAEGLNAALYIEAMARGEAFFIATATTDGAPLVLGFASDYLIQGTEYGTSVYVRGMAARCGIGSTLFRLAENDAIAKGAKTIRVEASLAGAAFYRAIGFKELGRGETHLMSGKPITCLFMRKTLGA